MTIKAAVSVNPGTFIQNVSIPNVTGNGTYNGQPYENWPHLCDVYIPSGVPIQRCFILLHGGGDTKNHFSYLLNIRNANGPNWKLMNYAKSMFIIPQGQTCNGIQSPTNNTVPYIDSPPQTGYPLGITTWSNAYTNSGWEDMVGPDGSVGSAGGFIYDLVQYAKANYGVLNFCLGGHSNGGFMAQRWWYEGADIFNYYFSTSGPLADTIASDPVSSANFIRPIWSQFGLKDTVLGIENLGTPPWYNFFNNTWLQPETERSVVDIAYPNLSVHEGAFETLRNRVAGTSGEYVDEEAFATTPLPIAIGNQFTATYNSGKIVVRLLDSVGHQLVAQTQALGASSMILPFLGFISSLSG